MTLSVSVVVATRERYDALDVCLYSLDAQDYPSFEVLVVENGSASPDVRRLAEAHSARYLHEPEGGLSRARNAGARNASGGIIAYIDDDARADPLWLDQLVGGFSDDQTAVVTGRILPMEVASAAQHLYQDIGGLDLGPTAKTVDRATPDWFQNSNFGGIGVGGNMAFRRGAFDVWPGFREGLGLGAPLHGAEEHHAFFSLVASGYRIRYRPTAVVRHPYPETMDDLCRMHIRNLERVSAYAMLMLIEVPEYRGRVLVYLATGMLRRPRWWQENSRRGYASLVPWGRALTAAVRGILLYGRARRYEKYHGGARNA